MTTSTAWKRWSARKCWFMLSETGLVNLFRVPRPGSIVVLEAQQAGRSWNQLGRKNRESGSNYGRALRRRLLGNLYKEKAFGTLGRLASSLALHLI